MAETSKDELVQLIRKFGAYLTVKFSNIFSISLNNMALVWSGEGRVDGPMEGFGTKSTFMMFLESAIFLTHWVFPILTVPAALGKNSRSLGAIAGFAVAVVFTWRLLRTPRGPQRRIQKRQAASSSNPGLPSETNTTSTSSGVCSTSEDLRAQNVVDEFFQPVKPTLGQIVRQKLSEGRKVTCRLLGVILEESSPEELQKQATVRSSVLEVLLEITKFCDLYLMERVLDDESEKKILQALEYAGVFTSGGLIKEKVLFCSTENGRSSFVRQLEPDWHIDTNPEVVSQLARFIKYQLHVTPIRPERTASNVFSSPSLEQFFGSI